MTGTTARLGADPCEVSGRCSREGDGFCLSAADVDATFNVRIHQNAMTDLSRVAARHANVDGHDISLIHRERGRGETERAGGHVDRLHRIRGDRQRLRDHRPMARH